MKKLTLIISIITCAAVLTACGAASSSAPQAPSTAPSSASSEASSIEDASSAAQTQLFKAGTWFCSAAGDYSYYFFNDDGKSGTVLSVENGRGVSFEYEIESGGEVMFHMGAVDDYSPATVEITDDDHMIIAWHEGIQMQLSYISPQTVDEFKFYDDEQLKEMAIAYYAAQTGDSADDIDATVETNEDGTVEVKVINKQSADSSILAQYSINRATAEGIDSDGAAVSLNSDNG